MGAKYKSYLTTISFMYFIMNAVNNTIILL